jgi:hypothetical protein
MMSKKKIVFWWIAVFIWIIILYFTAWYNYRKGYEECAKDFYQGKMKIDLVENKDGTKEWKWIK